MVDDWVLAGVARVMGRGGDRTMTARHELALVLCDASKSVSYDVD